MNREDITIHDVKNYIEGNANYLKDKLGLLPEELKEKIVSRQEICTTCSYLEYENSKPVKCSVCTCKYPHLTYSLDKNCPKKYWNNI